MDNKRLRNTTSPYLQQHADNPVDWWPWCDEALALARKEHKPILLSIGYSACHWCHVMAHESFEDEATATVMNEHFVNIKVDREERPDLDKIYQLAHQLLSQRPGGWPLTVFLTPEDQIPFFAGTYFPDQPRHGLPAFKDLLRQLVAAYQAQKPAIREQAVALQQAMEQVAPSSESAGAVMDNSPLATALQQLGGSFDSKLGGFGQAPKFPHPGDLELLLSRAGRAERHMATFSLEQMARGGINDQVAGGFCRYSVDERWMIPHFEKMLYDNGPLLGLYADAWKQTGSQLFRTTCEATAQWVMGEMQSAEGGYFSSLDADSEGEEGRYYLWQPEQVQSLLDEQQYSLFARLYGLDRPANFEGHWHLHCYSTVAALAAEDRLDVSTVEALIAQAREKLLAARADRVAPGRDDKILVSWNALMIKGMVRAGRLLQQDQWIGSAERACQFIEKVMWRDGRLLASYRDGRAHLSAYLDDYSYLVDALLELLQARWNEKQLRFAIELTEVMLEHFEDREQGGFFFTADDHEQLLQRPKSFTDDAMPSGNGVAARVLLQLGHLLGEQRYLDAAERTFYAAWPSMRQTPFAHTTALLALDEYLHPGTTVVIRAAGEELGLWQQTALKNYSMQQRLYAIPSTERFLPGLLADRPARETPVAYLCEGVSCRPPVTGLDQLAAQP